LVVPDKTHNLIIDHLAMGGVLVGLAFTAFLIYSLILTYKLNKLGAALQNRNEFALLSGIWVTYVVHLFISTDNLFMMTFGYASFGLIAQAYHANFPVKSKEGKVATKSRLMSPNTIRITATVVLLAVSFVNIKALLVDAKIKKIVTNQVQSGDEIIQTLRSFPNPKTAEQVIVYLLQNLQNCPVAIVASDDLLKLDDRSAQAWYFKTLCSDAANDQKTALTYIDKAIELQPMNLIYLDAKVRLEVRLKDLAAASKTLERIRTINPAYESIKSLEDLVAIQVKS
jgi:tetratricopeptide (TPR) repeat protein